MRAAPRRAPVPPAAGALRLSEEDFQRRVMDYAKLQGWRRVHIRPARVGKRVMTPYQGDGGLPDLILARGGVVLLAELKSAKGKPTGDQLEWLAAAGPNGYLWGPDDWPEVVAVLSRSAT